MKKGLFAFLLLCVGFARSLAAPPDSAKAPPASQREGYDLINTFTYDFFANFTATRYDNAPEEEKLKNQLLFNYNVSVNNRAQFRRFTVRTYFVNDYGFCHYFDSTTEKTADAYTFRNAVQVPFRKTGLAFAASYEVKSQFWPTRKYRITDTSKEQYLYTDYLSPGYKIFTLGLTWQHTTGATLDLGLVGGKVTRIKNQSLYDARNTDVLYGVRRGARDTTDFGINLVINVPPRMVSKKIGWAFNANVFAPRRELGRIKGYTADVSNALHFLFLRNLRLSMITQMKYDAAVQNRMFWTNQFMLGFYLSNRI